MEEIKIPGKNTNIKKITENNLSSSTLGEEGYKDFLSKQYQPKYKQNIESSGRMITDSGEDDEDQSVGKVVEKEIDNRVEKISDSSNELEKLLKDGFDSKPESVKRYIVSLLYYIKVASDAKIVQIAKASPSSPTHTRNISPDNISNYDKLLGEINALLGIKGSNKENKLDELIKNNESTTKDLISKFVDLFGKYNTEIVSNLINDGLGVSVKKLDNITGLIKNLAKLKPYDPTKIHYIKVDIEVSGSNRNIKFSKFDTTKPENTSTNFNSSEKYLVIEGNEKTLSIQSVTTSYSNALTLSTNTDKSHKHNRFIIYGSNVDEVSDIIKKGLSDKKIDFDNFKKQLGAHINLTIITPKEVDNLVVKTVETASNRILGYINEGNNKYIPGNFDYFFKRPVEEAIKNDIKELTKFPEYDSFNSNGYVKKLTEYVGSLEEKLQKFSNSVSDNIQSILTDLGPKEVTQPIVNNFLNSKNTAPKKTASKVVHNTSKNLLVKTNETKSAEEINKNKIKSELAEKVGVFKEKVESEIKAIITEKVSYAKYIEKAYGGAKESGVTKIEKLPIYARPDEIYGEFYYPFKEQLENNKSDNKVLGAIQNVGLALSKTQVEFLKNTISKIKNGGNILGNEFAINKPIKKCFTIPFYAEAGAGKTFTLNGFNEPAFSTNLTEENYEAVKQALGKQGISEKEITSFIAPKTDPNGDKIRGEYICSLSLLVQNLLPQKSANNNFKTINLNYHQSTEEIKNILDGVKNNAQIGQNYFLNIDEAHNYGSTDDLGYYEKLSLIKEFKRDYNKNNSGKRGVVAIVEATATPDLLTQEYKLVKHSNTNNEDKKGKAYREIKAREIKVANIRENLKSQKFENEQDKVNLIIDPSLPPYSQVNFHSSNDKWKSVFEEAKKNGRHIAIQYKNKNNDLPTYRFFEYKGGSHSEYQAVVEGKNTTELTSIPQDFLGSTNLIYDQNNYTGGDFQIKAWPEKGVNIIVRNLQKLGKDYSDPSLISEDMIQMLRRYRPFDFDNKKSYKNVFIQKEKDEIDEKFYQSLKNENITKISLTSLESLFQKQSAKNENDKSDYFDLNLVAQLFVCLRENIIDQNAQDRVNHLHKREYGLAKYLVDKKYDENKSVEGLIRVRDFNKGIQNFINSVELQKQNAESKINDLARKVNSIKINDANVVDFNRPSNDLKYKPHLKYVAKIDEKNKGIELETFIVGSDELFVPKYKDINFPDCFKKGDKKGDKKDNKEITIESFQKEANGLLTTVGAFQKKKQEEIDNENRKKQEQEEKQKILSDTKVEKNLEKKEEFLILDPKKKISKSELIESIKNQYGLSDEILKINVLDKIIEEEVGKDDPLAKNVIDAVENSNDVKKALLEKFKSDLREIFLDQMIDDKTIELLTGKKVDAKELKTSLNEIGINKDGKEDGKVAIDDVVKKLNDPELAFKIFASEADKKEKNQQAIIDVLERKTEELLNNKKEERERKEEKERQIKLLEENRKIEEDRIQKIKEKEKLEQNRLEEEKNNKIKDEGLRQASNENAIKKVLREEHGFDKGDLNVKNGTFFNSIFQDFINEEKKKVDFDKSKAVQNVLNRVSKEKKDDFFADIFWSDVTEILTQKNKKFYQSKNDLVLLNNKKVNLTEFEVPENGDLPKNYEEIINSFKKEKKQLAKEIFLSDPKSKNEEVVKFLDKIKAELDKESQKELEKQDWDETKKQREDYIKKEIAEKHGLSLNQLDVNATALKDNIFSSAIKNEIEKKDDYDSDTAVQNVLNEVAKNEEGKNEKFFSDIVCKDLRKILVIKESGFWNKAGNLVKEGVQNFVSTDVKDSTLLNKKKVALSLQADLQGIFKTLSKEKNGLDEKVIFSENYIDSFIDKLKKEKGKELKELSKEIFLSDPTEDQESNKEKIISLLGGVIKDVETELELKKKQDDEEEKLRIKQKEELEEKLGKEKEEFKKKIIKNLKDKGSYDPLKEIDEKFESELDSVVAKNIGKNQADQVAWDSIKNAIGKDKSNKKLFEMFRVDLATIIVERKDTLLLNNQKIKFDVLKQALQGKIRDNSEENSDDKITSNQLFEYLEQNQDKFQNLAIKIFESEKDKQDENCGIIVSALDEIVREVKDKEKEKSSANETESYADKSVNQSDNLNSFSNKESEIKEDDLKSNNSSKNPPKNFNSSMDDDFDFCDRESNKKPTKPDKVLEIGFSRLQDFTNEVKKGSGENINFCYVLEPDDLKKSESGEVRAQVEKGSKISSKLVIKQDKGGVCVSTVCGSDFKVSYGNLGGRNVKDGIINSAADIENGYDVQLELNKLIEDKWDNIVVDSALASIDVDQMQIPTIPKFPISFKKDNNVRYSINLQKSDDCKSANVVFMTPNNIDDIPEDASNIQYIHIPGTGDYGAKSYKVKIELIIDDEKIVGNKTYKKGDVVIYPDPVEISEGRPQMVELADQKEDSYIEAKEFMSKMKITAMRQIGLVNKSGEKQIKIGGMTLLTEGKDGRDGKIFNIDEKRLKDLSMNFAEVIYINKVKKKENAIENTELWGVNKTPNSKPSPIIESNSAVKLRDVGHEKEVHTIRLR